MEKKYKRSEDTEVVITQLMLPSHSNFSGKIHGGYILNLMDQIAFACASRHSGQYCVTASVNKVDFLAPIEVGELVTLKASVNYAGRTSMVIGLRVEAENIQTGNIKHCNSSYFTMVAKDNNGNSIPVPGLIIDSVDDVRRFARSLRRQEQGKMRVKRFTDAEFVLDDHLKALEGHNVEIDLEAIKSSSK